MKDFNINDFQIGQNLYIEASAGTGKTHTIELLVSKMLKNGISLSNILIVTYTEKATGELRDRIRTRIEECINNDKNFTGYYTALQDIGNAPIFTIHSFCKNILSNNYFEAKSSLNLELVNEEEIEKVIDWIIRDKWAYYDDFKIISDFDIDSFKIDCINVAKQCILYDNLELIKVRKINEKTPNESQIFILDHINELIEVWEDYKKRNNLITFSNMINYVHDEVCSIPDSTLLYRLREKYRYAIIDEFQDTNQKQWDIFKKVFLDSETNNIVVVGDPKQSIFSFQGAEIDVYKRAILEIGEANGRILSENNRSSDILINACNEIFEDGFFAEGNAAFVKSVCPPSGRKKIPALLNSKEIEPLWIAEPSDEHNFAKYAVSKIIECCKYDESGKTCLQIYDKNLKTMRNVRFSDFAILARARNEMPFIEKEMLKIGLPFYRYKDSSLFDGKECLDWISLLMAIDAPDFASSNRKILNQVLLSDFFRVKVDDIELEEYSNPTKQPMQSILQWKALAAKCQWAELQERIYIDTEIDKYFNNNEGLLSITKIKQIGNYIFEYLFTHNVTLEEIIKHLKGLASKTEKTESEGELIARANDYDAVPIMTIHSSKGLAFPIVIMMGTLIGANLSAPGPYIFCQNNKKYLGFDKESKDKSKNEEFLEWQRLVYVAYTRAQYILILPQYTSKNSWKGKGFFAYLGRIIPKMKASDFARKNDWSKAFSDSSEYEKEVRDIISQSQVQTNTNLSKNTALKQINDLQNSLEDLKTNQYSYSSLVDEIKGNNKELLADGEDDEIVIDKRINKDESGDELSEDDAFILLEKYKDYDNKASVIFAPNKYYKNKSEEYYVEDYPKGARLGNAIHEIFEVVNFREIGELRSETEAFDNSVLKNLINNYFIKQSLPIKGRDDWRKQTTNYVWNTLNADFPEIQGVSATEKFFKLKSLTDDVKKAEVEFFLDSSNKDLVNKFNSICKGFMDLLFVRKDINGNDYFSILDWKSDKLDEEFYSNKKMLTNVVNERYSVQRVLYSYCLIKWLKLFYGGLSEEEIFKQHFGGIYYVFVRGCKADYSNGIYAQTWKSFKDLNMSYNKLVKLIKK
jgi:exodeoxyribonuclease V beta subunit